MSFIVCYHHGVRWARCVGSHICICSEREWERAKAECVKKYNSSLLGITGGILLNTDFLSQ